MKKPKQEKEKQIGGIGTKSLFLGEFGFTYKSLEDSQSGIVLFVDCNYCDQEYNYIEFDVLRAKVNFLDEDMIILHSLELRVQSE